MGMGAGRGRRRAAASTTARDDEVSTLRAQAAELRRQLAEVIKRIEKLEQEN